MAAIRRTSDQIAVMARAGLVVAEMHHAVRVAARPGTTTAVLDGVARAVLERCGATSNFLGYHGFPATICASPNDVVVHGIPGAHVLAPGDLLSIDCGAIVGGWHGDAAFTMVVGDTPDPSAHRLIDTAERALAAGIAAAVPGNRISDIAVAVQAVAEGGGFGVVREYTGHGIGLAMHEEPDVPNLWPSGTPDRRLRAGMCLAIEPILTEGRPEVVVDADGWTVRTVDGSRACHVEHTIAITDDGPLVLTGLPGRASPR
ncbi:MAG: type I methionyl aminopeptidase [Acidimicrobiales bacterium]